MKTLCLVLQNVNDALNAKTLRYKHDATSHDVRPVATEGIRRQCPPNFSCAPQLLLRPEEFLST